MDGSEADANYQRERLRSRLAQEMDVLDGTTEAMLSRQEERLRRLVAHAKSRSAWHRSRLADVDPETMTTDDLRRIPPMTKNDLMEHWDAIVTDPSLSLAVANRHLGDLDDDAPSHLPGGFVVAATGGSTGHRAVVAWDRDGLVDGVIAAARTFAWLTRHGVLAPDTTPVRAQFGATSRIHISAAIAGIFSSATATRTVLFRPDDAVDAVIEAVNDLDPTDVTGYPSLLHRLAADALAGSLQIAPLRIGSQAEPLLPETRAVLEQAFGKIIVNIYGSTEALNLAISHPMHEGLHLNEDINVVEPIDATGAPVAVGQRSARILVTNLVNMATPLIRYEITDEVELRPGACGCTHPGRWIADVAGRHDDWFTYGDVTVHPHTFRTVLAAQPAVIEYQVRQTPDGAHVSVDTGGGAVDLTSIRESLVAGLERAGVPAPHVAVRDDGPVQRHGETAKLKRFIPLDPRGRQP